VVAHTGRFESRPLFLAPYTASGRRGAYLCRLWRRVCSSRTCLALEGRWRSPFRVGPHRRNRCIDRHEHYRVGWLAGITKRVKLCAGMRFYSVRVTRGVSQRSYRGAKYLRSAKSFPVCGCSKIRELMCDIFSEVGFSREPTRRILEFGVVAVTGSKRPLGCMVSSGLLMASPQGTRQASRCSPEKYREGHPLRRIGRLSECGSLARFYTTVLQGMSVQAIDGATQAELMAVMETALLSWPHKNKQLN
jgi:hypothetical protein